MSQRTQVSHAVRRTTSEETATEALNQLSREGYSLVTVSGGGSEGNVLWLIFQRVTVIEEPPAPVAGAPAVSGLLPPGGVIGGAVG